MVAPIIMQGGRMLATKLVPKVASGAMNFVKSHPKSSAITAATIAAQASQRDKEGLDQVSDRYAAVDGAPVAGAESVVRGLLDNKGALSTAAGLAGSVDGFRKSDAESVFGKATDGLRGGVIGGLTANLALRSQEAIARDGGGMQASLYGGAAAAMASLYNQDGGMGVVKSFMVGAGSAGAANKLHDDAGVSMSVASGIAGAGTGAALADNATKGAVLGGVGTGGLSALMGRFNDDEAEETPKQKKLRERLERQRQQEASMTQDEPKGIDMSDEAAGKIVDSIDRAFAHVAKDVAGDPLLK